MAEAVFQYKIEQEGLTELIAADSAATGPYHVGKPPHTGTMQILKARGIKYQHKARMIRDSDLKSFDYVVPMDDENLRDINTLRPGTANVTKLMQFAPHLGVRDVPDPYYTGRFNEVYLLVEEATRGLLETIKEDHKLTKEPASA